MGNYGIKVTAPGFDVSTATLLQQIFNSEKNCMKIAAVGSTSSTASGSRTVTVAHGLGITPGFMVYSEHEDDGDWHFGHVNLDWTVEAFTDGTNLSIVIGTNASEKVEIGYILFVDLAD